jgi:flagellar motor switch protein FliM
MEKVLNQGEIDAMVRRARGGDSSGKEEAKPTVVTVWDVRQAGQIGREQVQSISTLHEGFARNLTHAVGAYLRIEFTAALVSAEHLTYGEVLQRIPEVSYLASCKLSPVGATALLQLDLAVAFPLIDVLLGGEGSSTLPGRQLTEIEEQILETVMRIICRELQTAWQSLALEFQFEYRQRPDQVQHVMPSEEKTLSLSFEITLAESRGTLNLVVPAVVSNALLRKISAGWVTSKKMRVNPESERHLRERLLECPFRAELGMAAVGVPLGDLASLAPGSLLILRRRVRQAAVLSVGSEKMFTATVARHGATRAAQLLEPCLERKLEGKPTR